MIFIMRMTLLIEPNRAEVYDPIILAMRDRLWRVHKGTYSEKGKPMVKYELQREQDNRSCWLTLMEMECKGFHVLDFSIKLK